MRERERQTTWPALPGPSASVALQEALLMSSETLSDVARAQTGRDVARGPHHRVRAASVWLGFLTRHNAALCLAARSTLVQWFTVHTALGRKRRAASKIEEPLAQVVSLPERTRRHVPSQLLLPKPLSSWFTNREQNSEHSSREL